MERKLRSRIALLICLVFLFTSNCIQLVHAEDILIYNSGEIQKFTAETLEGTKPDISDPNVKTTTVSNGTVKFTFKITRGSKYDVLRSDNGGKYTKLTDFPLQYAKADDANEPIAVSIDYVDKYALSGHTYYYIVIVYDATGTVVQSNYGPFKAVVDYNVVSTPSKKIVLQLDNQYATANGKKHTLDVKPFLKDGRTMVPLRFISEALGAQVIWTENEQKIDVILNGNTITLWIGKSEARKNKVAVFMDVPAMVSNDRTLVPIRFVSENLNLKVDFNDDTKEITITESQSTEQSPVILTTPTPTPTTTINSTLMYVISTNKKYSGVSTSSSVSSRYNISFTNFNEKTGEFSGVIEWTGYYVTDDFSGKIDGDKIIFKQTARHQNNTTTLMDVAVTMKVEGSNKVSGTWIDTKTGSTGTTWFEFTPPAVADGKFNVEYDAKGFPSGKATLEFGNNVHFDGEVKVVSNNFIAIGVINYPNGTKAIGRFVNGKPDGLCSIIYPNQKAYLVDFAYGKPINFYVAKTIPVFHADEIEVYKADEIDVFQADTIEVFQADTIEEFHADSIDEYHADDVQPYKAEMIQMFQAEQVEMNTQIVTIDKYEAEFVKLNPPSPTNFDIPVGGFTSPSYVSPLAQAWTAHMMALPYLINNNMVYSY